jgi:hypothetical protein
MSLEGEGSACPGARNATPPWRGTACGPRFLSIRPTYARTRRAPSSRWRTPCRGRHHPPQLRDRAGTDTCRAGSVPGRPRSRGPVRHGENRPSSTPCSVRRRLGPWRSGRTIRGVGTRPRIGKLIVLPSGGVIIDTPAQGTGPLGDEDSLDASFTDIAECPSPAGSGMHPYRRAGCAVQAAWPTVPSSTNATRTTSI